MENEENFYLISWKEGFFKLKKKKKKRVQHYENNHKVYHVFVTGLLYSCIKYI